MVLAKIQTQMQRLTALLLVGLAVSPSVSAYQRLDTIVAVVEEDVVLASELLSRVESNGNLRLPKASCRQTTCWLTKLWNA